jgi:C4-dicarboxylate-specific signal transduction histidine kinase
MDRNRVEAYRLALFGRMVMGVSHEIDNHLSVVLGFAELIQLPGGKEGKVADGASKILAAGDRIGNLVKQYSRYVRPHEPVPEFFSPAEMLEEVLLFSRYDVTRGGVRFDAGAVPPGTASADRRDAGLALVALLSNASEAVRGTEGGTVTLRVDRDGSDWRFLVEDNGPPVDPALLPRFLEEGFTTKGEGHQGLGLPAAATLAASMGGRFDLSPRPGGGLSGLLVVPGRF